MSNTNRVTSEKSHYAEAIFKKQFIDGFKERYLTQFHEIYLRNHVNPNNAKSMSTWHIGFVHQGQCISYSSSSLAGYFCVDDIADNDDRAVMLDIFAEWKILNEFITNLLNFLCNLKYTNIPVFFDIFLPDELIEFIPNRFNNINKYSYEQFYNSITPESQKEYDKIRPEILYYGALKFML